MNRRGFMRAMLMLGAAPAIVKATSIMPLWVPPKEIVVVPAISHREMKRMYNYWSSAILDNIALAPKTPFIR